MSRISHQCPGATRLLEGRAQVRCFLINCKEKPTCVAKVVAGWFQSWSLESLWSDHAACLTLPHRGTHRPFTAKALKHHLHGRETVLESEDSEPRAQKLRAEAQPLGPECQLTEKVLRLICIDPADNSGPMTNFIQSAPSKSLLFMVTHDDGSSRWAHRLVTAGARVREASGGRAEHQACQGLSVHHLGEDKAPRSGMLLQGKGTGNHDEQTAFLEKWQAGGAHKS